MALERISSGISGLDAMIEGGFVKGRHGHTMAHADPLVRRVRTWIA